MARLGPAGAIIATVLIAAGCGNGSREAVPPPATITSTTSDAAATTPAPPSTPARSPRGNLVKQVGEEASIYTGDTLLIRWRVTEITVDPVCSLPDPQPPIAGHFVKVTISAQTSPEFTSDALPGGFGPHGNWGIVDADGITQPSANSIATTRCHPEESPFHIAPSSKYRFGIVLDARTPTGVLTFVPVGRPYGWEWSF